MAFSYRQEVCQVKEANVELIRATIENGSESSKGKIE